MPFSSHRIPRLQRLSCKDVETSTFLIQTGCQNWQYWLSDPYLQMSKAFRASPDTADTFLAQNWTAEVSMIPSAEAWCDEHHQTSQNESRPTETCETLQNFVVLPEWVCPGQWQPAPLCCRGGNVTAGGGSEGGLAAGAEYGPSDREHWQCQWGRGASLADTAIQRWCRGHPGPCCQVGPFRPGQEAYGEKARTSVITSASSGTHYATTLTENSHRRPRGRQEPLQSVLSARCFQFISQKWENGEWAPKRHAIYQYALHSWQSGLLRQTKQFKWTPARIVGQHTHTAHV